MVAIPAGVCKYKKLCVPPLGQPANKGDKVYHIFDMPNVSIDLASCGKRQEDSISTVAEEKILNIFEITDSCRKRDPLKIIRQNLA